MSIQKNETANASFTFYSYFSCNFFIC